MCAQRGRGNACVASGECGDASEVRALRMTQDWSKLQPRPVLTFFYVNYITLDHQPLQSKLIQAESSRACPTLPPCDVRGESAHLAFGAESAANLASQNLYVLVPDLRLKPRSSVEPKRENTRLLPQSRFI
jgi:hypothetical protein